MLKIEKKEVQYALVGALTIIVWFLYLRDKVAPLLEPVHPFLAMLIYNAGFLAGLYFLSSLLSGTVDKFRIASVAFLVFLGADLLFAPYLLSQTGELTKPEYWYVSTDAGIAGLWQSFGLEGKTLWVFTYVVSSSIFLFVLPVILSSPKKIRKSLPAG